MTFRIRLPRLLHQRSVTVASTVKMPLNVVWLVYMNEQSISLLFIKAEMMNPSLLLEMVLALVKPKHTWKYLEEC